MSNFEKAAQVVYESCYGRNLNPGQVSSIVRGLDDAGLLMPGLPEPEPYGELAQFGDEKVITGRRTSTVGLYIDDSQMSSESARELALMLLAAAEYAEKEQDNEQF